MPILQPPTQLFDWLNTPAPTSTAFAPVTNRHGNALYQYASAVQQGGFMALGSDYGATPKAYLPKCDANGTQFFSLVNPAGGSSTYYTGQPPPAAASQYGNLSMMRQDTPSASAAFVPQTADMNGNLYVHNRSKATQRAVMRSVATATNRYLAVLVNSGSSSAVLRLGEVLIYVPPAGYGGGLLGAGSITYYPLICELYRVAAANVTGGTTVTPMSCDTADTLPTGVSVLSSPTITASMGSLYRQDANATTATGENWYQRDDPNHKAIVVRPGEAVALICISNGTVTSATGGTTSNVPVDVSFVFTTAPA